MSSVVVRTEVLAAVKALATSYKVIDYSEVAPDPIPDNQTDTFIIVQFVGGTDEMIDIGGEGNQGWEEIGTVMLHLLAPTGFSSVPTLALGETIRTGLRGRRLGKNKDVVIEAVEPWTDVAGAAIRVQGPWHGFVSNLEYTRYVCG